MCLIKRAAVFFWLLLLFPITSIAEEANRLPLWQVGASIGAATIPHYTGSNQQHNLPLLFPAFIYRGDRLRASRGRVRGLFFSSKHFAIDIGASGQLPVYSENNDARKGMPDIPLTGEIGPRLVVRLYGDGNSNGIGILGRIPVRIVGGIDGTTGGWTMGPNIIIANIKNLPLGFNGFASAGIQYGSEDYNKLFYGVDEAYSTSWRPSYRAKRGISWFSVLFSASRQFNSNFSTRFYLQWRTLSGSVIADSPLVKTQNNLSASLWLTWLPWKSKRMEGDIERLPEPEEDLGI
jgi:outer membrane scaffolding protein for murein synthesis (MipA/OmpV family)